MRKRSKVVISLLLLCVFIGGFLFINYGEKITIDEAKTIALEDAPKFKPNNKNFEIWGTEETNRGWIIMISSIQPNFKEPSPNIYYKISRSGRIIERQNMALAQQDS